MYLSEKIYLSILILVFATFSSVTWYVLIPRNILEYNLGVNIFTSSIFMVFTLIFLSLLLSIKEEREWRTTEELVKTRVSWTIVFLSIELLELCKDPPSLFESKARAHGEKSMLHGIGVESPLKRALGKLTAKPEIEVDAKTIERLVSEPANRYISKLGKILQTIHETQAVYLRFLRPQVSSSLMLIEQNLQVLLEELEYGRDIPSHRLVPEIESTISFIIKSIYEMMEKGYA